MLPSLREERAQTYSPFLPIDPRSGVVLQVPVLAHNAKHGTITYEEPGTEERFTVPVTGGRCKLQWKPDWAMRWVALGIDYEMAGKDLIDSVTLSSKICRALGGTPPENTWQKPNSASRISSAPVNPISASTAAMMPFLAALPAWNGFIIVPKFRRTPPASEAAIASAILVR